MKKITLIAGLLGFTAVALGAFGAHALAERLAASGHEDAWRTAVLYHLVHAVAIYVTAISAPQGRSFQLAAWFWAVGILLFSGSLYCLSLGGPSWLGPVTPLGGLAFLGGWVVVALGGRAAPSDV